MAREVSAQAPGRARDPPLGHVGQLAPGDADDAVAGGSERGIATTITLERRARTVKRVGVELDHESLRLEEDIDLVAGEVRVGGCGKEPDAAHEVQEPAFGMRAGWKTLAAQRGAQSRSAHSTGSPVDRRSELCRVDQPSD